MNGAWYIPIRVAIVVGLLIAFGVWGCWDGSCDPKSQNYYKCARR